jgi:hypothetical protein
MESRCNASIDVAAGSTMPASGMASAIVLWVI